MLAFIIRFSKLMMEKFLLDSETIGSMERLDDLGSGGFGRVYKVAKSLLALKELSTVDHEGMRQLLNEYEIMSMLDHPNILKTKGIFLSDSNQPPCILLELCIKNLETAVKNRSLSNVETVMALYQIALGMKYVHFRHIVHRDLKPSNILIAKDGTIKISDFGISKIMSVTKQTSMTGGIGTQKFMAPEIVNEDDYDEKVDIYSFGVVVLFVLNGGDISLIKMVDVYRGKQPTLPEMLSEFAKKLIEECMRIEPKSRPSFSVICDLIEENKEKIVQLTATEKEEIENLIKIHNSKIPKYDI